MSVSMWVALVEGAVSVAVCWGRKRKRLVGGNFNSKSHLEYYPTDIDSTAASPTQFFPFSCSLSFFFSLSLFAVNIHSLSFLPVFHVHSGGSWIYESGGRWREPSQAHLLRLIPLPHCLSHSFSPHLSCIYFIYCSPVSRGDASFLHLFPLFLSNFKKRCTKCYDVRRSLTKFHTSR